MAKWEPHTIVKGEKRTYEILEFHAPGGHSELYKGQDKNSGIVAIKLVFGVTDFFKLKQFVDECDALEKLNHPNIVRLLDYSGIMQSQFFIVTEFLNGQTLQQQLTGGALQQRDAVNIALQVAEGLNAAHRQRVIHRDLKPGNIFLSTGGVKIIDFGLAGVTTGHAGTVPYMSPEQVRGAKCDSKTDIFSFGIVLYEMLSGRRPFDRSSKQETMNAIINEHPLRLQGIDSRLDAILVQCLSKEPTQRPSAGQLVSALGSL
jgi:serine/threonine protein kinase